MTPGAVPCRHCGATVVIRQIRDGRRWPFDRALRAAADVAEPLRYVPVAGGGHVVMVPAADMADRKLEGVRWFATRHTCAAWFMAHRRRDAAEVDSLADALAEVFGLEPAGGAA